VSQEDEDNAGRWEILETIYAHKDQWIQIRSDKVRLPDGTILDPFHVLESPPNVNIIALTPDNEVVLVEQWRHPVGKNVLEFPAGAVDEGEDPLSAAKRELLEETGFVSDDWHFLGTCDANPSRQNNQLYSFVAVGARKVAEQMLSEGELIRIRLLPWSEFRDDVGSGQRTMGAMHYAAVIWLDRFAQSRISGN